MSISLGVGRSFFGLFFCDTHTHNTRVDVDVDVVHMVFVSPSSFLLSLVLGGDICHGGGSFSKQKPHDDDDTPLPARAYGPSLESSALTATLSV
jgi:hypothetical protein